MATIDYIKITEEQKRQARQANIAAYLLNIGVSLTKEGNDWWRSKYNKSLTFHKNMFYRNDLGGAGKGVESGNAIDYLVNHMGKTYPEAVVSLTNFHVTPEVGGVDRGQRHKSKPFNISDIKINSNQNNVIQYLTDKRLIGLEIVKYVVVNNHLKQESGKHGNALFLIHDEHNNCVGIERQGIQEKRFKGIAKGSKYGYGFNIRFPSADGTFKYALFFESSIDLLSYIDKFKYREKKTLDGCILVSMAGCKIGFIQHMISTFSSSDIPLIAVLCVDNNSKKADALIESVKDENIDYMLRQPDPAHKDWNDQLKHEKQACTPIGRAIQRAVGDSLFDLNIDENEPKKSKSI
ncbi:MAG: DUF3991 and toprim domain-containing protein [Defluviitaleaceae bacterium]|nr:DUF3991 and toprim domain-containing protein [Defluviitaleaceae bacterium]